MSNFKKFVLNFSDTTLDLRKKVALMGILNLSPDSFYDGGWYKTEKQILERVEKMLKEGADIIDVGGESTRPGAHPISFEEEVKRTIPCIKKINRFFQVPISIDTYKAKVAKEACGAGAEMVNDISGLRFDPEMAQIVSANKAHLIIMHIKGSPKNMQENPHYEALIPEIISYLKESLRIAKEAGIAPEKVIVDPGIGFGKTVEHNLFILKNLKKLQVLGRPILIGVSRKSFIGKVLNIPLQQRLAGGIAATCVAVAEGARMVRCHDVRQTRQAVDLLDAIMKQKVHL
ncbi:dihydropteroate synthase [Candidatus Aerophobetes bacterium]|nr:dihydropteroate synthase [Candidatus Aerophobetes bacterium]